MEVYLYNSTVCRLCGEENDNGTLLYTNEEYNQELSETINTYLPLKVSDDGQLPRTICPGCTIQVEATVEFFNLIIKGQKILRDLHEREVEYKKSITKEIPDTEVIAEKIVYEINTSDGIYHVEHPISLQMAGLDKPKRKRGRPSKKLKTPEELAQEAAAAVAAKEEEARQQAQRAQEECHGKRRRKMPTRLKGAVQGRELEKIFIEEGVIDKAEGDPDAGAAEADGASTEPEVKTIGHVASSGEPVVVNVRKGRGRPKGAVRGAGQPSQCALCGLRFASVGRYMSHVASHNRDPLFDPESRNRPTPEETKEDPEERRNERADVADAEEPRPPTDPAREDGEEEPSGADKKQFECNQCDKKFSSKQSKSMHIKAVHRGERPYRCLECGLSFAYPRSLALHALAHRRRRAAADTGYACDVCHKVLSHPSSVTYHKQAAHGATQYVCGQCGKRFHHRQLLQRHQLVHSKRRPFDCEICSATFKTKANLRNHLQLHSGVKKFSCEVCPQRFSHQTSLTLHMRWHTGSKPYSCETCGKRFSQKGNLSEHERIHTGEKPFACPLCPRRFTTSSQRRLHAHRHGNENLRRPAAPRLVSERPTAPASEPPSDDAFPVGEKVTLVSKQEVGGDVIYVTYDASDASSFRVVHPREVRPSSGDPRRSPESAALTARVLEMCSQAVEADETEEAEEVENSEVPSACESSAESPVDRLDSLAIPQIARGDAAGRSPLRLRMRDGSVLAVTSLDGETLQILTQDGQAIPVEVNEYDEAEGVAASEAAPDELEADGAEPARYFTIV